MSIRYKAIRIIGAATETTDITPDTDTQYMSSYVLSLKKVKIKLVRNIGWKYTLEEPDGVYYRTDIDQYDKQIFVPETHWLFNYDYIFDMFDVGIASSIPDHRNKDMLIARQVLLFVAGLHDRLNKKYEV